MATIKLNVKNEIFKPTILPVKAVRNQMDQFLASLETQRLTAWASWQTDPDGMQQGKRLEDIYRELCREQGRLQAAVNHWKAAYPEPVDEDEAADEAIAEATADSEPEEY